jgi:hypothetical protein
MHRTLQATLFAVAGAALLCGCGGMKDRTYSVSEAEKKFVEFCKTEAELTVITRRSGNTQWIFLPLTEPIFDIKASSSAGTAKRRTSPLYLLSLDTEFADDAFRITYDIVPDVLSPKPSNYGSAFTENYTRKRQLLYQGLQQSFFNLEKDGGTPSDAPLFFVIVIADITKGVATKNTFLLKDFIAYSSDAIPFEEYYKRELADVLGNQDLIGDRNGRSLDYAEVTWSGFLTEQIENRIRFAFVQSDFPPQKDPDQLIASIVANTVKTYEFRDFTEAYLYNKRDKKEMLFTPEQLKTYEEKPLWEKEKGRMTVIRFEAPKDGQPSIRTLEDDEDTLYKGSK